ncbi:MAG: helix-turn-helix transcriptional regulator [Brevibacillus sp.]|nr:helix-turn-helix transcriptional regulator [Brevibacillus sp.]
MQDYNMNQAARRLGRTIRQARRNKRLSQQAASSLAGISLSHYKNIEAGRSIPGLSVLDAIIGAVSANRGCLYSLYLPLLVTPGQCLEYLLWCWEQGLIRQAYAAADKLYHLTKEGKISTRSVDIIIVFFDK